MSARLTNVDRWWINITQTKIVILKLNSPLPTLLWKKSSWKLKQEQNDVVNFKVSFLSMVKGVNSRLLPSSHVTAPPKVVFELRSLLMSIYHRVTLGKPNFVKEKALPNNFELNYRVACHKSNANDVAIACVKKGPETTPSWAIRSMSNCCLLDSPLVLIRAMSGSWGGNLHLKGLFWRKNFRLMPLSNDISLFI